MPRYLVGLQDHQGAPIALHFFQTTEAQKNALRNARYIARWNGAGARAWHGKVSSSPTQLLEKLMQDYPGAEFVVHVDEGLAEPLKDAEKPATVPKPAQPAPAERGALAEMASASAPAAPVTPEVWDQVFGPTPPARLAKLPKAFKDAIVAVTDEWTASNRKHYADPLGLYRRFAGPIEETQTVGASTIWRAGDLVFGAPIGASDAEVFEAFIGEQAMHALRDVPGTDAERARAMMVLARLMRAELRKNVGGKFKIERRPAQPSEPEQAEPVLKVRQVGFDIVERAEASINELFESAIARRKLVGRAAEAVRYEVRGLLSGLKAYLTFNRSWASDAKTGAHLRKYIRGELAAHLPDRFKERDIEGLTNALIKRLETAKEGLDRAEMVAAQQAASAERPRRGARRSATATAGKAKAAASPTPAAVPAAAPRAPTPAPAGAGGLVRVEMSDL
ncbi:MAG: hypothetical protein KC620_24265, partial [Myxococcales bacterium]|nr:hypothetical protein [Myxococcales bacterium]